MKKLITILTVVFLTITLFIGCEGVPGLTAIDQHGNPINEDNPLDSDTYIDYWTLTEFRTVNGVYLTHTNTDIKFSKQQDTVLFTPVIDTVTVNFWNVREYVDTVFTVGTSSIDSLYLVGSDTLFSNSGDFVPVKDYYEIELNFQHLGQGGINTASIFRYEE